MPIDYEVIGFVKSIGLETVITVQNKFIDITIVYQTESGKTQEYSEPSLAGGPIYEILEGLKNRKLIDDAQFNAGKAKARALENELFHRVQ